MQRILSLHLKSEWYEMIERGEKREEYREITPYWIVRLFEWRYFLVGSQIINDPITEAEASTIVEDGIFDCLASLSKRFDTVRFFYGYTKRSMLWECAGLTVGYGRKEWGAPEHEIIILKLGKQIQ